TATRRRAGPPGRRLAAWLAEAAAEFLADPAVSRVRRCAADDCVLLFLPAHPRRRWCSPTRCGNRVRVARHDRRHRASKRRASGLGGARPDDLAQVGEQLATAARAEPLAHPRDVVLDGLRRDEQALPDLPVGEAL